MDFLVPIPTRIKKEADIPKMLKDLGFIIDFKGSKGYIKLDHPDLILEFLVPEKGRGSDKPYKLPQLGMNATPLRFLSFLTDNVIRVKVEDFYLNMPHPANFALGQKDEVKIFFMGKGVEYQKISTEKFNTIEQSEKFMQSGGKIFACGTCIKSREQEGSDMCPISTMKDMYDIIKESDKVVTC